MSPQHRVRIQRGWHRSSNSSGGEIYTRIFRAMCSCGWRDDTREIEDEATGDGELHQMSMGPV